MGSYKLPWHGVGGVGGVYGELQADLARCGRCLWGLTSYVALRGRCLWGVTS